MGSWFSRMRASIRASYFWNGRKTVNSFFAKARFIKKPSDDLAKELNALDQKNGASGFDSGWLAASRFTSAPWVFIWKKEESVWQKLMGVGQFLADVTTHIFQGVKTGADAYYIGQKIRERRDSEYLIFEHEARPVEIEKNLLKPLIKGGEMRRYRIGPTQKRILFPYSKGVLLDQHVLAKQYPKAWSYLLRHKNFLSNREEGK